MHLHPNLRGYNRIDVVERFAFEMGKNVRLSFIHFNAKFYECHISMILLIHYSQANFIPSDGTVTRIPSFSTGRAERRWRVIIKDPQRQIKFFALYRKSNQLRRK
jgi:hypothetical protein